MTILKNIMTYLVVVLLYMSGTALADGEAPPVLDFQNHPRSPEHTNIFTGDLLSFDTRLSWTKRFNGDETFNESEMLPTHRSSTMAMAESSEENAMDMSSSGMSHMKMDGMGVVKSVRLEQSKVKIQHGPIDKYGMPEMTMLFKVEDPSMLEALKQGDEVGFNVDNSSGGFVVTHIMPMMAMMNSGMSGGDTDESASSASSMDATGVIKTIRTSQGKVKIEHGPIDKYGMPAMTMVFKVQDTAALEQLEQGMKVEFDIDNSSGGFEITDIKPIDQ